VILNQMMLHSRCGATQTLRKLLSDLSTISSDLHGLTRISTITFRHSGLHSTGAVSTPLSLISPLIPNDNADGDTIEEISQTGFDMAETQTFGTSNTQSSIWTCSSLVKSKRSVHTYDIYPEIPIETARRRKLDGATVTATWLFQPNS
jgi:hypothetical protein